MIRRFFTFIPFALLALGVLAVPLPATAAPQTRHIALDMTQFAFAPGRLRVNQGDTLVITLTASDVVHGFALDGYSITQRVVPGVPQQVILVAARRGKFRYRCSVTCGALHPFMIGELIVGPNDFFWRAGGVALIALAGLFVYLKRTEREGRKDL